MLRSMAARVKGSCKFHHRDVRLFSDTPARLASSWNSKLCTPFRDQGLISYGRGQIAVKDRKRMERMAGEAYGTPEAEYRRLIG